MSKNRKQQIEFKENKLKNSYHVLYSPIITIYGPMIYPAPRIRILMRADGQRGEGEGGWRWKSRVLWAPVKLHEPIGECNLLAL